MAVQRVRGKGLKGIPRTEYKEKKKVMTLSLTPTTIAALDALAKKQNISRSELVEQYGRGALYDRASNLIAQLETIPHSPQKWDAKTKSEIYYGLQEAIKLALELQELLPHPIAVKSHPQAIE